MNKTIANSPLAAPTLTEQLEGQRAHLSTCCSDPEFFSRLTIPQVDFVMGIGTSERISTAVRSLQQILSEDGNGFSVRQIVLANFGLTSYQIEQIKNALSAKSLLIEETEPHSAARSFNVGIRRAAQLNGPADFSVKLDDDSRLSQGGLAVILQGMRRNGLSMAAPVNVRTDRDYTDDADFDLLQGQHKSSGKTVYSSHATAAGRLDLARLMMG